MISVGVTGVGGGVGQSVLTSLAHAHIPLRTVGMDVRPMSLGLYWADARHLVPPVSREEAYIERLLSLVRGEGLQLLVPGLDFELHTLSAHREKFTAEGCQVAVSAPDVIALCRDKLALYRFCRERDLPFVETFPLQEAQERAKELSYPMIAKPHGGSASVGVHMLFTPEDVRSLPAQAHLIVQRYLPPREDWTPATAGADGRLDQSNEISIQYFVSRSGEVLGTFASVNRLKDGVPIDVVPEYDHPAIKPGLAIVQALVPLGLRGPINLQGRLTPNGFEFFEANARFTGITGLRAALGYREVEASVRDLVLGQPEEARRCLKPVKGYVGIRYVADALIPARRIAAMSEDRTSPARAEDRRHGLPQRVFVTGASGYIGASIVAELLQHPQIEEVRAGVRTEARGQALQEALGHPPKLTVALGELPDSPWPLEGVEQVVHAAGAREPDAASDSLVTNAEGARCLLRAMGEAGVQRLVYLSSQAVYGTRRPPLWSEALPPKPETPYSLSKWMAERIFLEDDSLAQITVLRSARVYGMGHFLRWHELPHKFARLAAQGLPLPVFEPGTRLDLLHVQDLCRAVVAGCGGAGACPQARVLNVGAGNTVSVGELAETTVRAAERLGLAAPAISIDAEKSTAARAFGMDIRLAGLHLAWTPKVPLEDGVEALIRAARPRPA